MHCSAFLVGGLKRAPQIFFLNFFVWVVLFRPNYGPVNQKKLPGIVPAELEKVPLFVLLILQFNIFSHDGDDNSSDGGDGDYEKINSEQ